MSGKKSQKLSDLLPIYLVIFCVMNWGLFWHYKTINGPTVPAVVVDKKQVRSKSSYNYYLTVGFTTSKRQRATSDLSVTKSNYQDFALDDTFLIKYAKDDPTQTAFVGQPFFETWAVVVYLFVTFIVVSSSVSKYRKSGGRQRIRRKKQRLSPPTSPAIAPTYSTKRTLMWTVLGVLVFSSGIVSCRHTASLDSTLPEANEYAQARLLSVEYRPDAPAAVALVRLLAEANELDTTQTVRLPLTAQQHALLQAKLSRLQMPAPVVLIKYPATALEQATLADEHATEPTSTGSTNSILNYNTLGVVLCIIGIVIFVANLSKYVQHSNSYD
ncbi:hypothetical protein [Hymenobacter norwichensis]|uniref:hypothetical protein n=1 Tax=Hymenobacter norwichensis TaxID=223903 RepID=UPI0003B57CF8|nr:hypothetical protein [Hymenobacter norwichensis]